MSSIRAMRAFTSATPKVAGEIVTCCPTMGATSVGEAIIRASRSRSC